MSAGARVALEDARPIALDIMAALRPACVELEVAGSIRRGAQSVGDIELVVVPKVHDVEEPDGLFSTRMRRRNVLSELLDELIASGLLIVHPDDPKRGERYAKLVHVQSGLQLDLFSVLPPAQFGMILLIRTGPASYSQRFVTDVRRLGRHVGDGALHEGPIVCSRRVAPCAIVPTPAETDVFAAVRRPWLAPEDRR